MTSENTMLLKITMDIRFLRKSPDQLLDLIEFILYGDKKSKQKVLKTFAGPSFGVKRGRIKPYTLKIGEYFNLTKIGRHIERDFFRGISATYWWGRLMTTRRLGFFQHNSSGNTIILNPALDDPEVPEYVIEQIIFHELLHAYFHDHPTIKLRSIHEKRFREAEKTFPKHDLVNQWIKANWSNLVALKKLERKQLKR